MNNKPASGKAVSIAPPRAEDGTGVHELVSRCKPLDENSLYCNVLQCSHFAATSAIARLDGSVAGFVSGYLLPESEDTLFVWQVAVAPEARGLGLGKRMMLDILSRRVCAGVQTLHTTITRSNKASEAVFQSLADSLGTDAQSRVLFDRDRHLGGNHASECLWEIGPFERSVIRELRKAA